MGQLSFVLNSIPLHPKCDTKYESAGKGTKQLRWKAASNEKQLSSNLLPIMFQV